MLLALAVLVTTLIGCSRQRQAPKPAAWAEQMQRNGTHRYNIRDAKGTRTHLIKRRGSAFTLADAQARPFGKASLRRHTRRVIMRGPAGVRLGYTVEEDAQVELRDTNDDVLARVLIDDRTLTLKNADDKALRVFEIAGDHVTSRAAKDTPKPPATDDTTKDTAAKRSAALTIAVPALTAQWTISDESLRRIQLITPAEGDAAANVARVFESGSGMGPLGLAILHTPGLDPVERLAIAAHLDAMPPENMPPLPQAPEANPKPAGEDEAPQDT